MPQKLKVVSKFGKGTKSKTMKGKLDFSTKATSKDFDRGGKRKKTAQSSKVVRRPYSRK